VSTKYYTSGGVVVTAAQRDAAILKRRRALDSDYPAVSFATHQIADARRRRTSVSEPYWYTAGELYDRQFTHPGESITDSLNALALAANQKKLRGNMIHARELDINAVTTVSELFELIDLPYRITKHATLSIGSRSDDPACFPTRLLRLEWRGEPE